MTNLIELNKVSQLSYKEPGRLASWLGEGLRQLGLFLPLGFITPLEIEGLENLAGGGPFIFAPNHSSHLDTLLLLKALPRQMRLQTRVAAAADYFFDQGWKARLMPLVLNAIPFVRHGTGSQGSLRNASQVLGSGQNLLIFPEGTRTPDGQLQPFKSGVGRLATGTGAAVVPVWIEGTFASMPKGCRWPRRQPVRIGFGQPIHVSPQANPAQVTAQVESAVRTLSGQARQEIEMGAA